MQEHFDLEACGIVYKATDGLSIRTILSIEQLKIAQGSRVALQGSSGAGKTTLLKVLSGIIRADTGTVRWGKPSFQISAKVAATCGEGNTAAFSSRILACLRGLRLSKTYCYLKLLLEKSPLLHGNVHEIFWIVSAFVPTHLPDTFPEARCSARLWPEC